MDGGAFDRWSKDLEQKFMDSAGQEGERGAFGDRCCPGDPEDVAVSLLHRLALEGKARVGSVEKAK